MANKKNWTRHFAKCLADYIRHEENGMGEIVIRDLTMEFFQNAIEGYENINDCTIVFVQLDENGIAKNSKK